MEIHKSTVSSPTCCSNEDCLWTITASNPNMMVRIDVIDSDIYSTVDCNFDSVTAYDGELQTLFDGISMCITFKTKPLQFNTSLL